MTIADAGQAQPLPASRDRIISWLDKILIYGSVFFIPYDLPVIHEVGIPLLGVAIALFVLRRDGREFLDFARRLGWILWPAILVMVLVMISLYANFDTILHSEFQGQAGWIRAAYQSTLFLVTLTFPLYLAFCLSRHGDWTAMLIRAAWWSLPIPVLVAFLQIANVLGLHAVAVLPYVGDVYDGGTIRINSVAREASWFGGYLCLTGSLVLLDLQHAVTRRGKAVRIAIVALLVVLLILGFSKSPYVAGLATAGTAVTMVFVIRRPWRGVAIGLFGLGLAVIVVMLGSLFLPKVMDRAVDAVSTRVATVYALFEPLLLGNTGYTSVGTRFGMSSAAISMATANPALGVGAGQFGYHVYNYFPLWGLNDETTVWLSNDSKYWPSPTNFYARILAESGYPALATYLLMRAVIVGAILLRLLRANSPTWGRDLAVLSLLAAQVVLDFNRDNFVNLTQWTVLGMALACMAGTQANPVSVRIWRPRRAYLAALTAVLAALPVLAFAAKPVAYTASATLLPKNSAVDIRATEGGVAGDGAALASFRVRRDRLGYFRKYWASRQVSARMIEDRPDIVRAAMRTAAPSPEGLSAFLTYRVTVLLADKQSTVTLEYDDSDPRIASQFLTLAIRQTDRTVAASAGRVADQARQLMGLAQAGPIDQESRRTLIDLSAASELQGAFDMAGENASFDYVERPGPSGTPWFQPVSVFALSLFMALQSLAVLLVVAILAARRDGSIFGGFLIRGRAGRLEAGTMDF